MIPHTYFINGEFVILDTWCDTHQYAQSGSFQQKLAAEQEVNHLFCFPKHSQNSSALHNYRDSSAGTDRHRLQ